MQEQTGPDSFCAYAPDIENCVAAGDSVEEAVSLFRQTVELHMQDLRAEGRELPVPRSVVSTIDVTDVA
ncbi:MAG: type II toxin-antitoxin system HicB family antitoxin [Candidatus Sericytochromatia bacterium]|nr:type II toxin-antitoxin system HicB family antitoxin [Candidatus Tanganyikabacteria bacterium]